MGYLPIFVDVGRRPCTVIGGGERAESRVRALLEAGAVVTVISLQVNDRLKLLTVGGYIKHIAREYQPGDLQGQYLAYVTVENQRVTQLAAGEARDLGIPINAADQPEASTFIAPATFRRGDLQVAISTGGSSPAVASLLRRRLEGEFGTGYATLLDIMRLARQSLLNREPDQGVRAAKLKSLAQALLNSVETLEESMLETILRQHLHIGLAELGFKRPKGRPLNGAGGAQAQNE